MPIYMKVDGIMSKPGAQQYPGANAFVSQIRAAHPRGVGMILVGESSKELIRSGQSRNGIIAILIGLLLPAVQKFDSGAHGDLSMLKGALGPAGQIGLLMGDGSVRTIGGSSGPSMVFHTITWA